MATTDPRAIELQQVCLDVSKAAMALFDSLDEHGVEAPWNDAATIIVLRDLIQNTEVIRQFFLRQSTQRMLALGVSPENLAKLAGLR